MFYVSIPINLDNKANNLPCLCACYPNYTMNENSIHRVFEVFFKSLAKTYGKSTS